MKSFDHAVYLPALQTNYVSFDTNRSRLDWYDASLHNFLKPGQINYPAALYSAGHAELSRDRSLKKEPMIHDRGSETVLVADSGGYQVATGAWNLNVQNGLDMTNLRNTILLWQEAYFDYAMTFDIPTLAIEKGNANSYDECLDVTLANLEFIRDKRKGNVKFLNVLQGRTKAEADHWCSRVWQYPFEGWAFAGGTARNLEMLLHRVIKLRDAYLLSDRDWIHVLGVGSMTTGVVLSALQQHLRSINPKLTVSFDSSTPSNITQYRQMFGYRPLTRHSFGPVSMEAPTQRGYASDDRTLFHYTEELGFPTETVVSKKLKLSNLVRGTGSAWDGQSYFMIQNHNYQVQFEMMAEAVQLPRENLPSDLGYFLDLLDHVMECEAPLSKINQNRNQIKKVNFDMHRVPEHSLIEFPKRREAIAWR